MKKLVLILILTTLAIPCLAKGKRPRLNILRDMEPDDAAWMLTVEDNSYYDINYGNFTLDYSTDDGWDVGVTSQNVPLSSGTQAQNYEYDSYLVLAKTWDRSWGQVSVGSMDGVQHQLHSFSYGDVLWRYNDWLRFHGGAYYVNKALSTVDNHVGYITGVVLGNDDLYFQADYYSGHSNISGASASVYFSPLYNLKLYTGVGVPERLSGNEFYGLVGIQFIFGGNE